MGRRALVGVLGCLGLLAIGAGNASFAGEADATLAEARAAAAAKDAEKALPLYFRALRETEDYGVKYAIRDEILALPFVGPPPVTDGEQAVVDRRIAEERLRDVEIQADALERRGMLHGARLLHRRVAEIKGVTADEEGAHAKAVERIERALCDEATAEERAEASAVADGMADPAVVFRKAEKIAEEGRGRVALRILRAIGFSSMPDAATRERAHAAADALRKRMLDTVPEDQAKAAEAIWQDPHWKGLAVSRSHRFLFIGPGSFVQAIKPGDRLRVDLACELIGDLVGRDLVEDGERLTIYYKERFDFPGGVAGGKRIDIGKQAIAMPIAGALHWHEMSHCAFDVGMAYKGFVEGIANFGAVFLLDAMGAHAEADNAIRSNRAHFQDDYLGRRIEYFRIQPYGPSAGFLLTPIPVADPEARKAKWATYRRFFRRVREMGIGDPRDAERMRYFAWLWGEQFGWDLLDAATRARFPVVPADRERVAEEYRRWLSLLGRAERAADAGAWNQAVEDLEKLIAGYPGSELCDRARFALAATHDAMGDAARRDAEYASLGVILKWKLCGPFYARHVSPLYPVFGPERTIDLAAEYPNPVETARWKDAKPDRSGFVDLLQHGYAYPDDAAVYAAADLVLPKAEPDAAVYLGFDDTAALWVDGALVEKWDDPHGFVRDHHVARAPLRAGRNRLLLKVVNHRGGWSFAARVVRPDRTPIEGLEVLEPGPDAKPASGAVPAAQAKGPAVFSEDFEKTRTISKKRWKPTVGEWTVDQGCLRRARPGNVAWRKFQIQPFSSKDPPSGLVWLVDKDLTSLADFAVEVVVRAPGGGLPKVAVTLHGEGKDDGLSGHTFLVQPGGEGLQVRLEEYDRLVYSATAEVAKADEHVLRLLRRGRTLSCVVDGKPFLEDVDLPVLSPPGIGLMTWDASMGIARVRVERLK